MFARPEPIEVSWRRCRTNHRVISSGGVSLIRWFVPKVPSASRWSGGGTQEARPTRDYFRVEDESGLRFWLYRDGLYEAAENGDTVPPKWFVHGLFA